MSANPKSILPSVLVLVAALAALAAAGFSWLSAYGGTAAASGRVEIVRETVAALEARQLWLEAVNELDSLRREPGLTRSEQADILYKMAKLSDLYLKDYHRALNWYTQAKALAPNASWADEADKRSIVCMENTGRKDQAQALLNRITSGEGPAEGPVVAVIDGRSVRWEEVRSAMQLSVTTADLAKPEVRQRLVSQYVFTFLLAQEAMKKGLESEDELKKAAEQGRRDSLAALYLRRELGDDPAPEKRNQFADQILKSHGVAIFNEAIPKP